MGLRNFSTEQSGGDFEVPNAEVGAARLVGIVDLGSQEKTYKGETKLKQQLRLTFELEQTMSDGRNFVLSRKFTASLHENSALRPVVETLLGRKIVEGDELDFNDILGKYCLVDVEAWGDNGEKRSIGTISKKPAAMPDFAGTVEPYLYDIDDGPTPLYEGFPEWLREVIAGAPEWQKATASVQAQQDAEADQPLFDAEVA